MRATPSSTLLSQYNNCPRHIDRADSFYIPHIKMADGVRFLFRHKIGARTNRSQMKKFIEENFMSIDREKYNSIFTQLIDILIDINKKTIIVGRNLSLDISLDGLKCTNDIHYTYSRADGPCYGIIISDMIDSKEVLEEHVTTHPLICAAAIADNTKNRIKYIEAIVFYDNGNKWEKFLIKLDRKANEYIKFASDSIKNLLRRYQIEEEHITNWSHSCLWCSQKGRCNRFRKLRMHHRQLVQRTRQRNN